MLVHTSSTTISRISTATWDTHSGLRWLRWNLELTGRARIHRGSYGGGASPSLARSASEQEGSSSHWQCASGAFLVQGGEGSPNVYVGAVLSDEPGWNTSLVETWGPSATWMAPDTDA